MVLVVAYHQGYIIGHEYGLRMLGRIGPCLLEDSREVMATKTKYGIALPMIGINITIDEGSSPAVPPNVNLSVDIAIRQILYNVEGPKEALGLHGFQNSNHRA